MPRLSSSCPPSALSEISMPHLLPMLLVSISNSAQITLDRCSEEQLLSAKRTVRNIDAASAANVIGEYLNSAQITLNAQIEQLLSAMRIHRAASKNS
jgi:hypothetical protein